ncbi:antibiotic biosynthesis monooxygenase, partial [Streptomyces collinus]
MSTPASLPYAFVAKIVAADGQHDALADLLAGAVALANEEVGTIVWFAVRTHADT